MIFSTKKLRLAARCLLVGYPLIFAALTVLLIFAFRHVITEGGGFITGFESIQFRRLIALLAPYLALPIAFVLALILYRQSRYALSVSAALGLLVVVFGTGQAYLRYQPDPIRDNFGPRAAPVSGFLILSPDALPSGFVEKRHFFSKREYSIDFVRTTGNGIQRLQVIESDLTKFVEPKQQSPIEFVHRGMTGRLYTVPDRMNPNRVTHYLFWLNPPKQRLMLTLSSSTSDNIAASQLVDILQSMREAH
jgi:hypothetical protein